MTAQIGVVGAGAWGTALAQMLSSDGREVLLWAPDHAYEHIRPLEGCPEYTLYRIDRVPDFRYWVETVAGQWADAVVLP